MDVEKIEGAFTFVVEDIDIGRRLDLFVTEKLLNVQRTKINTLICNGEILVNDGQKKPSSKLKPGDIVTGLIPQPEKYKFTPEDIPLDIIYEDDFLIVLNKQSGLVVHPAPGNWEGTLVNGLLHHFPEIETKEDDIRPGIVHRLDRDTSGVMLVAKDEKTLLKMIDLFHERRVRKEYIAVVHGVVATDSGSIDLPVGRHPSDRKKMSVFSPSGKSALTNYRVEKRYGLSSLIRCEIQTGRTHQIRVHCLSMNHPVVGDSVYRLSSKKKIQKSLEHERKILNAVKRQMLHARSIAIPHPSSGQYVEFKAPMPVDMTSLLCELDNALPADIY